MFSLISIFPINQPKWLIEEKAMSLRSEVWFKPPIAPTKIDKIIIVFKKFFLKQKESKIIGASFCQVIKIKAMFQFKPSITFGNQKWKGATPLFIIKEDAKIKLNKKFLFIKMLCSIFELNKIIANKRVLEANACVRKYLIEASAENKLFEFIESGIKDKRLISNPIQTLSHEEELILIKVPVINERENKSL